MGHHGLSGNRLATSHNLYSSD